jgi:hypothetical protein
MIKILSLIILIRRRYRGWSYIPGAAWIGRFDIGWGEGVKLM